MSAPPRKIPDPKAECQAQADELLALVDSLVAARPEAERRLHEYRFKLEGLVLGLPFWDEVRFQREESHRRIMNFGRARYAHEGERWGLLAQIDSARRSLRHEACLVAAQLSAIDQLEPLMGPPPHGTLPGRMFEMACHYGQTEVALWIIRQCPAAFEGPYAGIRPSFVLACESGHLDTARAVWRALGTELCRRYKEGDPRPLPPILAEWVAADEAAGAGASTGTGAGASTSAGEA